ncbi:hypothetical protein ABPG72_002610 [Tetrahymena utriculariae]
MFFQRQVVEQILIKRQKQKQEIIINIEKTIQQLSKPPSSFSAKEINKAAGFTLVENTCILQRRSQGLFAAKEMKKSKLYEKHSELHLKEFCGTKQQPQDKKYFSKSTSQEEGQINSIQYLLCKTCNSNSNNQGQQHQRLQKMIEKAIEQEIIIGQQYRECQYFKKQEENKYADESQFGDFMEIYNKYYTNNEINHEVLENRIRTIVEALHKQCEHIFSITIRPLHEIWDSISDEIVSNTIDQINVNLREVSANNGEIFIEF